jgi:23S rRNA pseudouridine1911/1915/1917 synthase
MKTTILLHKRVGDIVQGDKTGDKPLSDVVKEYIKDKYNKPGKFFCSACRPPYNGIVVFYEPAKVDTNE